MNFGSGPVVGATPGLATGSLVGIGSFGGGSLSVPDGYMSGDPIPVATSTWENMTLFDLGMVPGTYRTVWGSETEGNLDFIEINIVPEPGALSLSVLALTGFVIMRRRRGSC